MYVIEHFVDKRWTVNTEAVPVSENKFTTEAKALAAIDSLRRHPVFLMDRFRVRKACSCGEAESNRIHNPWNENPETGFKTHEFKAV